ncbi:hypothetical protein [Paraburkholderia sp. SIMBA_054]|uniref:hypothetical protein n=1 Tax=Paraburkholderia sp. SIMBA_054 TaxID=3085795 RepID=UPI003979A856
MERRALLLHLGDVIEAIACVMKCAHRYNTFGEAVRQEESLMTFSILQEVEPEMTPLEFVTRAAGAYFLWPKGLLDVSLNRRSLAHLVEHDLFADNEPGWRAYVEHLHADVPWGAALNMNLTFRPSEPRRRRKILTDARPRCQPPSMSCSVRKHASSIEPDPGHSPYSPPPPDTRRPHRRERDQPASSGRPGDAVQSGQRLTQQRRFVAVARGRNEWRDHVAAAIAEGDHLVPFQVLVSAVPQVVAFFATVVVPSPWMTVSSSSPS